MTNKLPDIGLREKEKSLKKIKRLGIAVSTVIAASASIAPGAFAATAPSSSYTSPFFKYPELSLCPPPAGISQPGTCPFVGQLQGK